MSDLNNENLGWGTEGVRFNGPFGTGKSEPLTVGKVEFGPANPADSLPDFTTHSWGEIVNTKPLSEFQLDQIAKTFGLERSVSVATKAEESPAIVPAEALPIRDGYVYRGEWIWWRNSQGPKQVQAANGNDNWRNIQLFPEYYQWARPTFVDGKYVD